MREWAQGELAAGRVTIAEIKRERSSEPPPSDPGPQRLGPQASRALSRGHLRAIFPPPARCVAGGSWQAAPQ
jgi:hypothetical protein